MDSFQISYLCSNVCVWMLAYILYGENQTDNSKVEHKIVWFIVIVSFTQIAFKT